MPRAPNPLHDYDRNPPQWTKKELQRALSHANLEVVNALYKNAKDYVNGHNLKGSKTMASDAKEQLERDRDEWATELYTSFGHDLDIIGHDDFAHRACRGAIVYCAGAGATTIKKVSISIPVALRWHGEVADLSQETPDPTSPAGQQDKLVTPSSRAPVSAPPPPVLLARALTLSNFQFLCLPVAQGIRVPAVRLFADGLFTAASGGALSITDFKYQPLEDRLVQRGTLTDLDQQCLYYGSGNYEMAIENDEDLRAGVRSLRMEDTNMMTVQVRVQDDFGRWDVSLLASMADDKVEQPFNRYPFGPDLPINDFGTQGPPAPASQKTLSIRTGTHSGGSSKRRRGDQGTFEQVVP